MPRGPRRDWRPSSRRSGARWRTRPLTGLRRGTCAKSWSVIVAGVVGLQVSESTPDRPRLRPGGTRRRAAVRWPFADGTTTMSKAFTRESDPGDDDDEIALPALPAG